MSEANTAPASYLSNPVYAALAAQLGRHKLGKSPSLLEVVAMLLCGNSATEVNKFLVSRGEATVYPTTLLSLGKVVRALTPEQKHTLVDLHNSRILKPEEQLVLRDPPRPEPPAKPVVLSTESSYVDTLKRVLASILQRIEAMEKEARDGVLSDKREAQLMAYHEKVREMRKELEQERLKSEVAQAWKQACVQIGKLAFEFIPDEAKRRDFIARVREIENRDW